MKNRFQTAILGGGLCGLSAAYFLTKAGRETVLIEVDSEVGGLSKTIRSGDFLFDIGGHRFFTTDKEMESFVRELMGDELIEVSRKSRIFLKNRFFDYPLRPLNAVSGLGLPDTIKVIADYSVERLKAFGGKKRRGASDASLEDWVVKKFGRTLFNIYFREYSEKVWGMDCREISASWVAERIKGLSLGKAIKNAFFGDGGEKVPSLVDKFLYPSKGIGRISERLREEIVRANSLLTNTSVVRVNHNGEGVESIVVGNGAGTSVIDAGRFISTLPLTALVGMLDPAPPEEILQAASRLGFRDLIVAAVMVDRERVTDQSWIYIPEKRIPFGRIHEPKNWSAEMAPEGKTLLVVEFFCFRGDALWSRPDGEISALAVDGLAGLGFIRKDEAVGSAIVRAPKAYPLFDVGYEEHCEVIYGYLSRFENLQAVGRAGAFKYLNMDHAVRAGMEAAEKILSEGGAAPLTPAGASDPGPLCQL